MIDLKTETVLPLSKAAAYVPTTRGERVHPSTLHRWITTGKDGVKLEYLQVGATRCTSVEALGRFFAALAEASTKNTPTGPYDPVGVREQLVKRGVKLNRSCA